MSILEIAFAPATVRRALKYLLIVGAILITINHGDAILRGDLPSGRIARILLTLLVPYCVSTLSTIEAVRAARRSPATDA